jgi:glycine/D-amino acid oxidase-like deaminating enzyme
MGVNADIVVIGGGVIGTAVSYYLAKSGLDVCSIEKRGITDGTSSRCDGHIAVYDSVPGHHCKLSKKSLEFFPGLSDELGIDIGWSQEGTLLLAESEEEYETTPHAAPDYLSSRHPAVGQHAGDRRAGGD